YLLAGRRRELRAGATVRGRRARDRTRGAERSGAGDPLCVELLHRRARPRRGRALEPAPRAAPELRAALPLAARPAPAEGERDGALSLRLARRSVPRALFRPRAVRAV